MSGRDVFEASAKRSDLYYGFRRLFEEFDYVLLPTAQVMPFDAAQPWPQQVAGRSMSTYHRWMEVSTIATLINAPALAVPAGFVDGLPVGLQLIGTNHGERDLLEFALTWEQRSDWVNRVKPALFERP